MSDPIAKVTSGLPRRRRLYGFAVAVGAPVALTAVLAPARQSLGLDTVLLLFVLVSVIASVLGGVVPALVASVVSVGLANFFFTQPYGTLQVANATELIDLVIFLAVAVLVGVVTEFGVRARARSERARIQAEWLTDLSNLDHGPESVEVALAKARAVFGMNEVQLVRGDEVVAGVGERAADDAIVAADAGEQWQLRLYGPESMGADRRVLTSLAQTAVRLWRTEQLGQKARRAEELARIDELRSSLLAAVGHDLRNPLAAITVAAATLRQDDLALEPDERSELLATIEEHSRRLDHIIGNLLDASRVQAGALSMHRQPTEFLEVLGSVLRPGEPTVELMIPEDLPLLNADPGLLERVVANLLDNAARHAGPDSAVTLAAHRDPSAPGRVAISVIDHGAGVDPQQYEEIFAPFQHFTDRVSTGVGLGLAIARGFTEAMGGTLTPSATPGGGLTMTVTLEVADGPLTHR
ncbi:MAG: DUF4118 domain-containing protein [Propionicimonas sp.]